jgi:hypothetical protein
MKEGSSETPPILVDAVVERPSCRDGDLSALWSSGWWLRVTYRLPREPAREDLREVAVADPASSVAIRLPLSDEFAAFQIDLLLRGVKRGERSAARLLFACVHEEWGRVRTVGREPAWDALLAFLAPLAVTECPAVTADREWDEWRELRDAA